MSVRAPSATVWKAVLASLSGEPLAAADFRSKAVCLDTSEVAAPGLSVSLAAGASAGSIYAVFWVLRGVKGRRVFSGSGPPLCDPATLAPPRGWPLAARALPIKSRPPPLCSGWNPAVLPLSWNWTPPLSSGLFRSESPLCRCV